MLMFIQFILIDFTVKSSIAGHAIELCKNLFYSYTEGLFCIRIIHSFLIFYVKQTLAQTYINNLFFMSFFFTTHVLGHF